MVRVFKCKSFDRPRYHIRFSFVYRIGVICPWRIRIIGTLFKRLGRDGVSNRQNSGNSVQKPLKRVRILRLVELIKFSPDKFAPDKFVPTQLHVLFTAASRAVCLDLIHGE
jgi:hypothetical protein